MICKENGIGIEGCYVQNSTSEVIPLGGNIFFYYNSSSIFILYSFKIKNFFNLESRIINNQKHSCESLDGGKIRYMIHCKLYYFLTLNLILVLGCRKDNNVFGRGQVWTDAHIRYQCTNEGTTKVLGEKFKISIIFQDALMMMVYLLI